MLGKNRIIRNYIFVELLKQISKYETNVYEKIKIIRGIAKFSAFNETGKYSDDFLEKQLIACGNNNIHFNNDCMPEADTYLHVMTEAGQIGGHTRVVKNWIEFDTKRTYSILFTSQNRPVPKFLADLVEKSGGKIYRLVGKNPLKQTKQLLEISKKFEKIILSTHMYDPIPILAYSNKNWKTPIYLYNHANFRFWLGVSVADMVLDLSMDDKDRSIQKRGIKNTRVLPIPIKETIKVVGKVIDYNLIKQKYQIPNEAKVITSMADDYKYTIVKKYNFPKFLKNILTYDDNIYFVVIGGDPKEGKWRKVVKNKRVKILGRKKMEEVEEILNITDVYVDSFPFPSYTCCLEAVSKNIPVVCYENKSYRLDATRKLRVKDKKDLRDRILRYLNAKEKYCSKDVEAEIAKNHYKEYWVKKMEQIFSEEINHKNNNFYSKFVINETEALNNDIYCKLNRDFYNYFEGLSLKNNLLVELLMNLFFLK